MRPPIMVVLEIVKEDIKSSTIFDETTGEVKRMPIKIYCIWYSAIKQSFEKQWFPINLITKLSISKKLKTSFNVFDNVTLKTKLFSNQQSIRATNFTHKNLTITLKNTSNQRNTPPSMVIKSIEDIPQKEKLPIFHKSTGERKRIASDKKLKCIWFNPKAGKFSEAYFSPEVLMLSEKTNHKNEIEDMLKNLI